MVWPLSSTDGRYVAFQLLDSSPAYSFPALENQGLVPDGATPLRHRNSASGGHLVPVGPKAGQTLTFRVLCFSRREVCREKLKRCTKPECKAT